MPTRIPRPGKATEVPVLRVDSAHQILAEVGALAATFPSAKHLSSWVKACPGDSQSEGVNYRHRPPKATVPYDEFSIRLQTLP
jgi:transposase